MRRIIIAAILIFACFALYAEEPTLKDIIAGLAATSAEYQQNNLELVKASAGYQEGRAGLLPALSFSVPGSFSHTPRTLLPGFPEDVELQNNRTINLSPKLSVSQYLPTAGTLGLSLTNSFTITDPGGVSPASYADALGLEPVYGYTPSLSVTLSQPILFEDIYHAVVTFVEENWAIARSNFIINRNMLIYKLSESYHDLLYLRQSVRLRQARLENAQNNYLKAVKNHEMGQLAQVLLLKAEAGQKKAQLDLGNLQSNYRVALDNFSRAYGIEPEQLDTYFASGEVALDAQLAALNLPDPLLAAAQVTEKAFKSNMQLMVARKQQALSQAALIQARAKEAPLLTLGSGFTFNAINNEHETVSDAFQAPFGEDSNPSFFFNLTLSGKIYDAGAGNNRLKQLAGSLEQSTLNLKQKETELKQGAEILVEKLNRGRANKEYQQLSLQITRFEYETGQNDYKMGLLSPEGLTTLKLNYDSAVLEYLKPQMEYALLQLELLMFMGEDLESIIQGDVNHE